MLVGAGSVTDRIPVPSVRSTRRDRQRMARLLLDWVTVTVGNNAPASRLCALALAFQPLPRWHMAVEVLEWIATKEARARLLELAKGAAEARLTREAAAACKRLEARK